MNKARELNKAALPDQLTSEPAVAKAVAELERMGLDPQERVIYEGEVKKHMVDAIQLKTAREQGMQHTVLRLLGRRFGKPPASIAVRLQSLTQESLDDLAFALLDFTSYADVERWMTRN